MNRREKRRRLRLTQNTPEKNFGVRGKLPVVFAFADTHSTLAFHRLENISQTGIAIITANYVQPQTLIHGSINDRDITLTVVHSTFDPVNNIFNTGLKILDKSKKIDLVEWFHEIEGCEIEDL